MKPQHYEMHSTLHPGGEIPLIWKASFIKSLPLRTISKRNWSINQTAEPNCGGVLRGLVGVSGDTRLAADTREGGGRSLPSPGRTEPGGGENGTFQGQEVVLCGQEGSSASANHWSPTTVGVVLKAPTMFYWKLLECFSESFECFCGTDKWRMTGAARDDRRWNGKQRKNNQSRAESNKTTMWNINIKKHNNFVV